MVQYFLGQHAPQDQLRMSSPASDVSQSPQRAASNQEEEGEFEDDASSSSEDEIPGPSHAASTDAVLPWISDRPEPEPTLTPLSNGAMGIRTGGTPTKIGTLRKTYPGVVAWNNGIQKKKGGGRRNPKYICVDCRCEEVESFPDTLVTGSKRKRRDGAKYKCKECGSLKIWKRPKSAPSTSVVSTRISSDSDSEVQCVKKKVKVEPPSTPSKPSTVLGPHQSPPGEDSIDHFSKYVTSMLRGLPRKKCIRVQKEVISLVLESHLRESESSD